MPHNPAHAIGVIDQLLHRAAAAKLGSREQTALLQQAQLRIALEHLRRDTPDVPPAALSIDDAARIFDVPPELLTVGINTDQLPPAAGSMWCANLAPHAHHKTWPEPGPHCPGVASPDTPETTCHRAWGSRTVIHSAHAWWDVRYLRFPWCPGIQHHETVTATYIPPAQPVDAHPTPDEQIMMDVLGAPVEELRPKLTADVGHDPDCNTLHTHALCPPPGDMPAPTSAERHQLDDALRARRYHEETRAYIARMANTPWAGLSTPIHEAELPGEPIYDVGEFAHLACGVANYGSGTRCTRPAGHPRTIHIAHDRAGNHVGEWDVVGA